MSVAFLKFLSTALMQIGKGLEQFHSGMGILSRGQDRWKGVNVPPH
ncbi:hypothetical protein QF000_000701 [Paraburkholderia atlantica]